MFYVLQSAVLINLLNIQEDESFKLTTYFHFDTTVQLVGHSSVTKYQAASLVSFVTKQ